MKKIWAEPRAMARVARGVHPPLKALLAKVRSLGEIAIATATYGIAASCQEVKQLTLGSKYP